MQTNHKFSINHQLYNKLSDIENSGNITKVRNSFVKELILSDPLVIDPLQSFIHYKDRPFNYRYYMAELLWYLSADPSTTMIEKYSGMWKELKDDNEEVNSNYGVYIFGKNLSGIIRLLKKDPFTRQAIMYIGNSQNILEFSKDTICTSYLSFWIRDGKLNMKVQMRSNDLVYGLMYDAPFFSLIMQVIYNELLKTYEHLELGHYYHYSDNFHFYEKHFDLVKKMLENGYESDNILKSKIKKDFIKFSSIHGPYYDTLHLQTFNKELTNIYEEQLLNNYTFDFKTAKQLIYSYIYE